MDISEAVRRLAKPFFDAGEDKVYVARCCGRIFVGKIPAGKCQACGSTPQNDVLMKADLST